MNIREMIKRMKLVLDEMSDTRKDAIEYLKSQARPYTEHVCKLMLWGDNEEWVKDWSDEIWNYISSVDGVILRGNKRLKKKDYLDNFFFKYLEADWELAHRLKRVGNTFVQRDGYPESKTIINTTRAYDVYRDFVNIITHKMENDDLTYSDVINLCRQYLRGV